MKGFDLQLSFNNFKFIKLENNWLVQQKAHLKKHCMVNHFYTSDEFNDEHPRPGFRAHMKTGGSRSGVKQSRRASSSPTKHVKRAKMQHNQQRSKGHQVTLEDLFGSFY